MESVILTIACKKSDNKAFKGQEDGNWYNLNSDVVSYLEKLNKGDKIQIDYTKKGTSRYVSKLEKAGASAPVEAASPSVDGFKCAVCGAAMKTDKFKVCYMCNKKGLKAPNEGGKSSSSQSFTNKSNYGSPEDIAGKEIGCALNAAATVASGCGFADPETAAQFVKSLAESLLEWVRAKK